VTAVLEELVSGRDSDVRGSLGERGQMFPGHAVQERVGGQSRRSDLDHDHHRQLVLLSRYTLVQLSAGGQGRRSPFDRDHGPPLTCVKHGMTPANRLDACRQPGQLRHAAHRTGPGDHRAASRPRPTPANAASVPASIPGPAPGAGLMRGTIPAVAPGCGPIGLNVARRQVRPTYQTLRRASYRPMSAADGSPPGSPNVMWSSWTPMIFGGRQ
jgi:hypothetical protein